MATVKKRKEKKSVYEGNVYIQATFNNTIVTITDLKGKAVSYGLREVHVFVKGPGMGRENAIRSLGAMGLKVKSISDVTPIPHNGCRPRKTRSM